MSDEFYALLKAKRTQLISERANLLDSVNYAQRRIKDLSTALDGIDRVLNLEDSEPDVTLTEDASQSLASLLESFLENSATPLFTDQLVEKAMRAGFDFSGKAPARVVNLTLQRLSTQKGRNVFKLDDKSWSSLPF